VEFSWGWPRAFFPGGTNSGDLSFYQLETERKTKVCRKLSKPRVWPSWHPLPTSVLTCWWVICYGASVCWVCFEYSEIQRMRSVVFIVSYDFTIRRLKFNRCSNPAEGRVAACVVFFV